MIAVNFEFEPAPGKKEDYFALGMALKAVAGKFDGFISIERFENVTHSGKFVSLSFWRDEAAVQAWRNAGVHPSARAHSLFSDYRLRVAQVIRDYGMHARDEAPADSQSAHG